MRSPRLTVVLTIAALLLLAACGDFFVSNDTVTAIAVTPANGLLKPGATQQFTATATLANGNTKDVTSSATWSSSNTSIATISNSGLATGVALGSTTIAASVPANATSNSKVNGQTTLTVSNATILTVTLTPANPVVRVGSTQQMSAVATLSDNSTRDVTSTGAWSSSAPAIATVNASGLVTGVAAGTAVVSVTVGTITASTPVTVQ
ncbi:MAG TPA: Ig-like domain-containing protein [Terriglobales bacterium]|nr:Ig-like domain-containing protein [Terriglobales bacterium]